MTIDEMMAALEAVLGALYEQTDYTHFPDLLEAAENIAGAIRYDFSGVIPEFPVVMCDGGFDF